MAHTFLKCTARVLALAAVVATLGACSQSEETVKIGVIGPLTGGGAAWGQAAVEAGRILAEETNAGGGLKIGDKAYKVEIISYDDKYNTSEAVAAYNRLVNQDGVKYMLILTGASTAALKQNVEKDDVVALTGSYTGGTLDKNTRHTFRYYSDPDQYAGPFVDWLKQKVPGRRIVTINPNDETGWHVADVSDSAYKSAGFQILGKELFERSTKDFQPLLTKVIAQSPDIIDLGSTPPATAGLVVRQARELGYDKRFTKMGGAGPREIVAAAGAGASEGIINLLWVDSNNPGYRRLADNYKQHKGQEPNEVILTYYDAMNVMLHAIQQAGKVDDANAVAAAFSKVLPMNSVQGEEIRLGGMEHYGSNTQFLTVTYVGEIRNGEPVVIEKLPR